MNACKIKTYKYRGNLFTITKQSKLKLYDCFIILLFLVTTLIGCKKESPQKVNNDYSSESKYFTFDWNGKHFKNCRKEWDFMGSGLSISFDTLYENNLYVQGGQYCKGEDIYFSLGIKMNKNYFDTFYLPKGEDFSLSFRATNFKLRSYDNYKSFWIKINNFDSTKNILDGNFGGTLIEDNGNEDIIINNGYFKTNLK